MYRVSLLHLTPKPLTPEPYSIYKGATVLELYSVKGKGE